MLIPKKMVDIKIDGLPPPPKVVEIFLLISGYKVIALLNNLMLFFVIGEKMSDSLISKKKSEI